MIKRTLGAIADMCGGTLTDDRFAEIAIAGVTKDSRDVQPGQLYIPLAGYNFDGHDFASNALDSGAAALIWQSNRQIPDELADEPLLLVDDPLTALQRLAASYREELNLKVVGITGSNGKTTTKDMVASVLSGMFRVHKTEGNLNNHIGLPITVLQLDETIDVVVLEMGMSGFGEIELLAGIAKPDIVVITNIGDAHLLQLGSREGIAKAKLEIVSGLRDGGLLLFNGDEPLLHTGVKNLQLPGSIHIQTFGLQANNDWKAVHVKVDAISSAFNVEGIESFASLSLPVPGHHNVSNALAAIAVGRALGIPAAKIREGFEGLRLTGMRIEPVRAYNGAMLLNDAYNANPTAVRAAVDLVAQLSGYRRKWLVLGDMLELGAQDAELHADIGDYITPHKADRVLTYGALSRHTASAASKSFEKKPGAAEEIGAKTDPSSAQTEAAVVAFEDKEELIECLRASLSPEDLVLVKGSRSMRMEEIVHALQRV
ncbi:UDP-N-acetylmuramoyl-tripeptide--D-alanyl-D-alanine ligase [Paenibacillus nasutitermitis]|uniref:UDP-N-acetylmuramoyl-tripeptide--D-alanyl-D-alanine ligase n=1 Tax=Paenibacillus nasutitermitis TaxID=1652958 RepID=A0A916Z149_9BACL|nr:UDP-N-acetylmuramoyl-tripeptide--D-alanyl-D-alanine ligase [Paenibacillus nasutitermitis]GGD71039.1 UDP-N-acetylmuramoyl-tripeptide--D-alanyl-D-alanine ligase [Paenibacillus nasutitermitis]